MQVFYTVRSGDTLVSIARRWSIPLNSLIAANNFISPNNIYPGQQLSMPPGINTYVVQQGDSIFLVAQRYGIPIQEIITANGINPPYVITPDQVLTIPSGVPYYTVRPGDTLYTIAGKYNVTLNGQPKPEYIINANYGLTQNIIPGMALAIPYPPPGGSGKIAYVFSDNQAFYLGLYDPVTGIRKTVVRDETDSTSNIFWSPDSTQIASVNGSGIISVINANTAKVSKIDQTTPLAFVDWSPSGKELVYSTGNQIRIYNTSTFSFKSINKPGTSYVQWFANGAELIFEAKDAAGISQLYRSNIDGSSERQITNNTNGLLNYVRLSPDGNFVLYTSPGASISIIYTLELASGITYEIPGGPEAKNYSPTWSPDSTKIAYSATQYSNGKYYSLLRLVGPRGEGDSTLAVSSCFFSPVSWSPDSKRIIYLSGCRNDNPANEMWSIDITKPVPINILYGFSFYNFDWSK